MDRPQGEWVKFGILEFSREPGERRKHRRRTQDTEDALNDFYGGTANTDDARKPDTASGERRTRSSRPWSRPGQPYTHFERPVASSADIADRPYGRERRDAGRRKDEDDDYLSEPPDGQSWRSGEWKYAARLMRPRGVSAPERKVLSLKPTLVMTRRGRRFKSEPFEYEEGWNDRQLAEELKYQYANLKLQDVGLFQKLVAYKQIAYVIVLQARCLKEDPKWVVAKSMPITTKGDKEGRNAFMYLLRHPPDDYRWTGTIEKMIKPGVILYLEVIETFDSAKVYIGILFMAMLSLGVALAYGFTMDGDFSTGFSIASWMITAFGFFAALVSISEIAGLESFTSFQTGVGMEEAEDVPRDLGGYR
jgi:hypothetical protein